MTITSIGYDGTVQEGQWALLAPRLGKPGHFVEANAFAPTIGGAGARAVTLAAGSAFRDGVLAISDAPIVVNLASVGSGSRWDTIIIQRHWATNATTVTVRQGTGAPNEVLGTDAPGTDTDQIVCLARVDTGSADVGQILDMRNYAEVVLSGWGPPVAGSQLLGPRLVPIAGATYLDLRTKLRWRAAISNEFTGGITWTPDDLPTATTFPLAGSAGTLVPFNATPAFRNVGGLVKMQGNVKRSNGAPLVAAGGVTDVVVGTFPSGSRPADFRYFVVPEIGGTDRVRCYVDPGGALRVFTDGLDVTAIGLDPISFYADGN